MLEPLLRLPTPPSLEEVEAHIPRVHPVAKGVQRPRWSVMIPTYNDRDLLARTLESVLSQAPEPEVMQIEVVDAASTTGDPKRVVDEVGRGRVAFHRLASNRGPAHSFNACIERAIGYWVHILHDDDTVMPGFYEAYDSVIRRCPDARTVVGQVVYVDESDRWTAVSGVIPPPGGGIVPDFTERMISRQLAQFPGVVVHRDAYEAVGGYCTLFHHVIDWDMWFRLSRFAPVACVDRPYARYRVHKDSDTSRRVVSGANMQETYSMIRLNLARLGSPASPTEELAWRSHWAAKCQSMAWLLHSRGNAIGEYNQLRWALMLEPTASRWLAFAKAWLKERVLGRRSQPELAK